MKTFKGIKETKPKVKVLKSAIMQKIDRGYIHQMKGGGFLFTPEKLEVGSDIFIYSVGDDRTQPVDVGGEFEMKDGKYLIIKDSVVQEINDKPQSKADQFSNLLKNRR